MTQKDSKKEAVDSKNVSDGFGNNSEIGESILQDLINDEEDE